MSDSWKPDESDSVDVDTFQEWLHYTAESRDLDEGELLDRLVSAYWVLDEMSDVVPDAPAGDVDSGSGARPDSDRLTEWRSSPSDRRPPVDGPGRVRTEDQSSGERAGDDAVDPGDESDDVGNAPDETTAPNETNASDETDPTDASTDDAVTAEIQALRDSIHTQLDLATTVTELRRQVSDLSLDVEQQRSRQDGFTDRITDDITRLNQRIERIDAQVDGDTDALDERVDALERSLDDLESTYGEFEAWVDGEFDEIEVLFERLIETADGLDDRLDDAERSADAVEEIATARRDLGELRRDAIDLGIDGGTCESCGTSVDLSMLTDPACPACDRSFSDITPDRWWNPLSNPTLHTAPDSRNAMSADEATHPRDIVDGN